MKTKNLKNLGKGFMLALAIGTVVFTSGCTKTMDCNVEYDHAHKYVSASGIETWRRSEKENLDGFLWTEIVEAANDEINEINALDLVKVQGNEKGLLEIINSNHPYTEYEYKYSQMVGKVMTTRRRYGTDPNHSRLTGNMRDVTYKYHAYKIYTDKDGRRKALKSPDVDDIFEVVGEYPYVKMDDMHTLIYSDSYTKDNQLIK